MTIADQLDAIGAGWNVAEMSLTLLTSISVGGQKVFGPQVIPHYNPGLIKFKGTGLVKTLGYKSVRWLEGILTYDQWAYFSSTYCDNGLSGKVTVLTNLGTSSYVRLNAIMVLPVPDTMQAKNWYTAAPIMLTRLVPAS